jgi:hydroxypyruvate isomerase
LVGSRSMSEPLRSSLNVTFHFWGRPLVDALDGAVAAGFASIELLDPFGVDLDDLEDALDRRGLYVDLFNLPMGDFQAGDRGFAGDPRRRVEFRKGVEQAARIADRLGTAKVNALAGRRVRGESESAQYRCLAEQLGWAADLLAEHGVRLCTELLNPIETPGFLLSSLDRVTATLGELDGRVGFQLDVYHLQRAQGELIPTIAATAAITSHYQIADAPHRTEPGTGEINYTNVLRAIGATGYRGLVGCEFRPSGRNPDAFSWMDAMGVVRA